MTKKEKPSYGFNFAMVSSNILTVVALVGGFWAIDSHYASATDLQGMQKSVETQIRSVKIERLDDEVFKLDMKKQAQRGKLSIEDEAMHQRYLRKLNDAQKEQRTADKK